jgi:hypothetical protein
MAQGIRRQTDIFRIQQTPMVQYIKRKRPKISLTYILDPKMNGLSHGIRTQIHLYMAKQ